MIFGATTVHATIKYLLYLYCGAVLPDDDDTLFGTLLLPLRGSIHPSQGHFRIDEAIQVGGLQLGLGEPTVLVVLWEF